MATLWSRDRWRREWQQLRGVDWQALELREAAGWPLLLKLLSCVLVLALALAAMYMWVISDHRAALADARQEESRLLSVFEQKSAQAAQLPETRSQLASLDAVVLELRDMLPTSAEIPSLLDSINDAAVENHLNIDTIERKPTVTHDYYIERAFDIEVRGGYHQIARFVADMAALSRLVTQHDFTLAPAEDSGGALRLSMLARTYSYREPAAADAEDTGASGGQP